VVDDPFAAVVDDPFADIAAVMGSPGGGAGAPEEGGDVLTQLERAVRRELDMFGLDDEIGNRKRRATEMALALEQGGQRAPARTLLALLDADPRM
jgi:hypothetical protein